MNPLKERLESQTKREITREEVDARLQMADTKRARLIEEQKHKSAAEVLKSKEKASKVKYIETVKLEEARHELEEKIKKAEIKRQEILGDIQNKARLMGDMTEERQHNKSRKDLGHLVAMEARLHTAELKHREELAKKTDKAKASSDRVEEVREKMNLRLEMKRIEIDEKLQNAELKREGELQYKITKAKTMGTPKKKKSIIG
eukprot:TRINITY_DN38663_c0_g2_i2.p1 TRINITY_DN38663_c0_g2~~TRINITY_DN38663_c0_g2_i2.p1  ORF type:complete len:224 (+),score=71.39 TRINITY_DN38663_c0_g2_i2:65-673(+)